MASNNLVPTLVQHLQDMKTSDPKLFAEMKSDFPIFQMISKRLIDLVNETEEEKEHMKQSVKDFEAAFEEVKEEEEEELNVDDRDAPNVYPYKKCCECGDRQSCGMYVEDDWFCQDCQPEESPEMDGDGFVICQTCKEGGGKCEGECEGN